MARAYTKYIKTYLSGMSTHSKKRVCVTRNMMISAVLRGKSYNIQQLRLLLKSETYLSNLENWNVAADHYCWIAKPNLTFYIQKPCFEAFYIQKPCFEAFYIQKNPA